ncbi:LysR family transcriptional regulator [Rhodococcus hoagii]|nr:LysR family transcriptional regulator [Prescottella equi]
MVRWGGASFGRAPRRNARPPTVHGSDLSLRALQALSVVVDEGHFGRAAEKLYITTPALSQQIRARDQGGVRSARLRETASIPARGEGDPLIQGSRPTHPGRHSRSVRLQLTGLSAPTNLITAPSDTVWPALRAAWEAPSPDALDAPWELLHLDWPGQ